MAAPEGTLPMSLSSDFSCHHACSPFLPPNRGPAYTQHTLPPVLHRVPRTPPLLALGLLAFALAGLACGGDDASEPLPEATATAEGAGVAPTSAEPNDVSQSIVPKLTAPVSRFAVSQDDLPLGGYLTSIQNTFEISLEMYSESPIFEGQEEGLALLSDWGYLGGYETGYEPEGRIISVLNGAHWIGVETHLFDSETGARAAFDYFVTKLEESGSTEVPAEGVGNDSSAWRLTSGKIGRSSVDATYHRVVLRRGNFVGVVMTWGARPFMGVEQALELARIVDEKTLGLLPTIEPTPTSEYRGPQDQ